MKLFISYARDDKSFVYELADRLNKEAQHDVWIDRRLTGADLWWDTILNSIEACDCFVYIMTPRSIGSIYCQAELNYALELRKPVLPMKLKDCVTPDSLKMIQFIDITSASLIETLFQSVTSLSRLEVRLVKSGKVWRFPEPRPIRPDVPQAKEDAPESVHEVLAAAEEALDDGNFELAEDLYTNVMKADRGVLGQIALKRLNTLRTDGERRKHYENVQRLVELKSMQVAEELFEEYVRKHGTEYDPDNYTELFNIDVALNIYGDDTDTVQITPAPPEPIAKFEAIPPAGQTPLEVQFKNRSQGKIVQYLWDFDGDGITDSIEENPVHTFDKWNKFVVTLTIMDEYGQSDTHSETIFADDNQEHDEPQQVTSQDIAHPDYYAQRMAMIPAGHFFHGNMQEAYLNTYYIDFYPVTNQDYFEFMKQTGANAPDTWKGGKFREEEAIFPVTGISYDEAHAFCKWIGKRLPTALEWEKAARGEKGNLYPWGDYFDGGRCNSEQAPLNNVTPVNAYPQGASPYGICDMAGNVWEWTQDEVESKGLRNKTKQVLKGGSFRSLPDSLRAANLASVFPEKRKGDIGFRCVWSPDDA